MSKLLVTGQHFTANAPDPVGDGARHPKTGACAPKLFELSADPSASLSSVPTSSEAAFNAIECVIQNAPGKKKCRSTIVATAMVQRRLREFTPNSSGWLALALRPSRSKVGVVTERNDVLAMTNNDAQGAASFADAIGALISEPFDFRKFVKISPEHRHDRLALRLHTRLNFLSKNPRLLCHVSPYFNGNLALL